MRLTRLFQYILTVAGGLATATVMAFPVSDAYVSIEKNPVPLGTTAVADPYGMATNMSVGSIAYGGGTILLNDANGNDLVTMDPTWWNTPGVVYTTTTNTMFIDFVNLDVTAFTFKLGANQNATGWIRAYYDTPTNSNTLLTGNFGINSTTTNTYGVYVKNPSSACTVITRIEIDPPFVWGAGNFGITTGAGGCAEVPEPSTTGLLGLGLLALGFMTYGNRRRRQGLVS
jgi:hypothetical protein